MELNALNLALVLGILVLLLSVLCAVIYVVCRQYPDGDAVFPRHADNFMEIRNSSNSSSLKTLEVDELDSKSGNPNPLPNLPKIIVTTASMRLKHI